MSASSRQHSRFRRLSLISFAAAGALWGLPLSQALAAEAYPSKPVKLIVPFAA